MKRVKYFLLCSVISVFSGCHCDIQPEKLQGYWVSDSGRPSMRIEMEEDHSYKVTVYHRLADNKVCPVKYEVVRKLSGIYIRGEGRILISYSSKKDMLFLSPGGTYRRQKFLPTPPHAN